MDAALRDHFDVTGTRLTAVLALVALPYALAVLSFLAGEPRAGLAAGAAALVALFAGVVWLGFTARRLSRSRR